MVFFGQCFFSVGGSFGWWFFSVDGFFGRWFFSIGGFFKEKSVLKESRMNGAESMLDTLTNNGVEVCFTNPGTSEMHMVAAMGKSEAMRAILCLFEGVCSGAADGYGRIANKPACTLFHLGPGLSNASANIHNALKASSPMLNLVGDHATYHKKYDAPLNSDVIGLAAPVSHWVRTSRDAMSLPADAAEAVQAANVMPGQISTLIVPADCAWDESVAPLGAQPMPKMSLVEDAAVKRAAEMLSNGKPTAILMSKFALYEKCLELADQISQATGAKIYCDTLNRVIQRGEGRCRVERLGYFAEQATKQIKDLEQLIMIGTKAPVGFFAYPGQVSEFYPENCELHTLAHFSEDPEDALEKLAAELDAVSRAPRRIALERPGLGRGELSPRTIGQAFAEMLPTDAIVIDEGGTCGGACFSLSESAAPHDWLGITGGSIGYGLPAAIGAAVAGNGRKTVCIHGDGGALYTIQSLWTMARENLDICVVIFANRKYQILQVELSRVGAQTMTPRTLDMLDLSRPDLDFVQIARGMGVPATRATTTEEFNRQFKAAMAENGPRLIEAMLDR